MKINELHSTPLVRLRWLTVAALEIKTGDTTFVIDPYVTASASSDLTAEVFEAHADEIFDEAENRLHAQKAVLYLLMGQN